MKQKVLIAVLILLILAVGGIWAYVFFFAPNGAPDVFSDFGQSNEMADKQGTSVDEWRATSTQKTQPGETQQLYKLTDKRVAAATFTAAGVRFMERGTGYIYEVAFSGENETQITNTTIPRVVEAVFSSGGGRVAALSEDSGSRRVIVGTVTKNDAGEGVVDGVSLPAGARELAFSDSGETLQFITESERGAAAYTYNIAEQTQTKLFETPLSYIEVLWGTPTYVYTTPAAAQRGFLYTIQDGALTYTTEGLPGLTAERFGETLLVSAARDRALETFVLKDDGSTTRSPLRLFLEKCERDVRATSSLYCAAPDVIPPGTYPDDWYKGAVSLSDSLWRYDLTAKEGEQVLKIMDLSERAETEIDVSEIVVGTDGKYIIFINKNDDSLWLYTLDQN